MDEEVKILHATDLHCTYDKIDQLKRWLKSKEEKIDIVLLSGDIANVPFELYHTAPQELLKEHHDHLEQITSGFLSVADKVFFVPGNHDTLSHYNSSPSKCEEVNFPFNVHSRKIQIAPKLYLLGMGGSVPSFSEGKELWEGFPYSTDQKFGEALGGFLDPLIEEESSPEDSYIFMTHAGPSCSSTTEVRNPPEPVIIAGSDVLYDYLTREKMQSHLLMNVHGHVHPSIGVSSVGSLSIINPGALMEGNFGIYSLRLIPNRQPAWKLIYTSLHRLE